MKTLICILVVLSFTKALNAQEAEQFSMKQAIAYSQSKSNTVRTAQLDIQRSKAEVQEYQSIGIPKLSAQIEYRSLELAPTL